MSFPVRWSVKFLILPLVALAVCPPSALAQDTVDVTFYYHGPSTPAIFLVGEFNGWNNSSSPMAFVGGDLWKGTARVTAGSYTPGAVEYKFFNGNSTWPNDPLNPRSDNNHNSNSILYVRDPVIYQLATTDQIAGNSLSTAVKTSSPTIGAYIYPKLRETVDTGTIVLRIDTSTFVGLGSAYDSASQRFQFQVPYQLSNGSHEAYLSVGSNSDSVSFTIIGPLQILTLGGFSTRYATRTLIGLVQDTSIHRVKIVSGAGDTVITTATGGNFSAVVALKEGVNTFRALVDSPSVIRSDSMTVTRIVDHRPNALAQIAAGPSSTIILSATSSTDPDNRGLTYEWMDDPRSPLGLTGHTEGSLSIPKPIDAGEYYFSLIAQDSLGDADTTSTYFVIGADSSLSVPGYASNPSWVKQARIYFLFPMAFSSTQNLAGVTARLSYIKALGFNVIWLMPVMKNASRIDQHYGPGYNIVDFYNVAPEYGTNADLLNLVNQAHSLGLHVILDITPNHTSYLHPFSVNAHTYRQASPYWDWYQHATDASDTRGLGWGTDAGGFVYYDGFGNQLLNYNWSNLDARTEMINVYKYWIQKFGIDGFRFDVYWGPHNRYGEANWGIPVRTALKHIKPDILILGETDGTGFGSQNNYADNGLGGCDLAYDWNLLHGTPGVSGITNFGFTQSAITDLNSLIQNGGYWPGPNARYLRFMENQDEDVIFYNNPNPSTYYDANQTTAFEKTMPMASVIFTVPGVPELWNGQEVGWGYGISGAKEARNRSTINWDFAGKDLLQPHYQKIAQIRGHFPTFWTQQMVTVTTNQPLVYAFTRPYWDDNAVVAVNMSPNALQVSVPLDYTNLAGPISDGTPYYLNNVYADSSSLIRFSAGRDTVSFPLAGYGTAIFVIADSSIHLTFPSLTGVSEHEDGRTISDFRLSQNYPNPFNPSTRFDYDLPLRTSVSLKVYDLLGREVFVLVDQVMGPGRFTATWNGLNSSGSPVGSGVYFARMQAGAYVSVKKLLLIR